MSHELATSRPRQPAPRPAARPASFASLPPFARLYVAVVIACGMAALGVTPLLSNLERPALFALLLVMSLVASTITLPLPFRRGTTTLWASHAVDLGSLLAFGPYEASVIAAVGAWGRSTFRERGSQPAYKKIFAMASLALTVQCAGLVMTWVRDGHTDTVGGLLGPFAAALLIYHLIGTALPAGAIASSTRQRLVRTWRDRCSSRTPSHLMAAAGAALTKLVLDHGADVWTLALIALPVYVTNRSYRLFIKRIEREQVQVATASDVQLSVIDALATAIEAKDHTSHEQVRKMQGYAAGVARAVGLADDDVRGVQVAALLHDIGNLAVPDHILSKAGTLTYEEFEKVKIHPVVGAEILRRVPFPYPVAPLILAHHEHWDGSGYPAGLQGEAIPLGARVLSLVDSYLALASNRPHRPGLPQPEVLSALRRAAGTILDPVLVETFLGLLPDLERQLAIDAAADGPTDRAHAPARQDAGGNAVLEHIVKAQQEARAIRQIADELGGTLGVPETMALIASNLNGLVPFTCCGLFLWKADRGAFVCVNATGVAAERLGEVSAPSLAALEQATGAMHDDGGAEHDLTSTLLVPVGLRDEVIGALIVCNGAAGAYTQEHRRLLARVADQAAPVIRNSVVFERTQRESLTDPLTSLPNRRYMVQHLEQELARAARRDLALALVMMDLDGFKDINDTLGHQVGDRALRDVSAVLRASVRPYDLCVRYGGDEFVVILLECDQQQAERRRRELQDAVATMCFDAAPGRPVPLSLSAGAAVYPADGTTPDELVAEADRRMYADKVARRARTLTAAQG